MSGYRIPGRGRVAADTPVAFSFDGAATARDAIAAHD